jgi:SNF2 family DNA or RNA helicase
VEKEQSQGGAVLNLAMGLGKTVIGFSLINQDDPMPTLVFCPVGLLHQWKFECEDKTDFRCFIFHGKSRKDFAEKFDEMKPHVVLASFGSARDEELHSRPWHRIIVDEIHYIRNIRTIVFKALCQYEAKYRIGLTGTPLVNGPFDLFSYCLFLKVLDMPMLAKGANMDKKLHLFLKKQFSFRLDRGLMRQIMFQMSLQDCSMDVALTTYHETLHELDLEKIELGIYKRLEERISRNAASHTEEQSTSHMMLLSYIVYLRQAANDLYLVRAQLASDPDYEEETMQPGAKTAKCVELVSRVPSTEKIIVFSEFLGISLSPH